MKSRGFTIERLPGDGIEHFYSKEKINAMNEKWEAAWSLTEYSKVAGEKSYNFYSHKIKVLLSSAKDILISFLAIPENLNLNELRNKGRNICRLITYTNLNEVIKEESLNHVNLPKKWLLIEDNYGKPVSKAHAENLIKDNLILSVGPYMRIELEWKRSFLQNYKPTIYAQEIHRDREDFISPATKSELIQLVKTAPFDVGHGNENIFPTSSGNAFIIDTEYKGESPDETIYKMLKRINTR